MSSTAEDRTEGTISELQDRKIEVIQLKQNRDNRLRIYEKNLRCIEP